MKRKKLVMLVGFLPNPRLYKRLALEKQEYDTHLICWDRGSEMQLKPKEDGFTVHSLSIPAAGNPVKRLPAYALFSRKAQRLLQMIDPDVIHVQGLDMLRIACRYKEHTLKPVQIIYEVADLHRLLIDKPSNISKKMLQRFLRQEEKRCCQEIALLIVTSEKFLDEYLGSYVPKDKTLFMPNTPDLSAFAEYKPKAYNRDDFTVGFIGDVRYPQQMRNLIEAAKACDIKVLFAGFEQGGNEIESLCRSYSHGEWFGRFNFKEQAAALYEKCDVIYSVYDADMTNVRVALPNKLYEAIYCERPIIVAKGTYLAELVERWGVGVAVDHREPKELSAVLQRMRDDTEYYQAFCYRCHEQKRIADTETYNKLLKDCLHQMCIGII